MRIFSQSEIGTLLECPAKHGFAHGNLAGFPIEAKVKPIKLRQGTAWGRAVAVFHSLVHDRGVEAAGQEGARQLEASLAADAAAAEAAGTYDAEEHQEILANMLPLFSYYCVTTTPLMLTRMENEVTLPIGNGWAYRARFDGIHTDPDGNLWLVEFKFREDLTPYEQIVLWRQLRWYALAYQAEAGVPIYGVIVDEGHNTKMGEIKYNKDGKVSAIQTCTLEDYLTACRTRNTVPNENTVRRLTTKKWHARHEIHFRPDELEEALEEIMSTARLIWMYENGTLLPIRNPGRSRCPGCQYNIICPNPKDSRLRDALYQPNRYIEQPAA
jgi:hypothetical protein